MCVCVCVCGVCVWVGVGVGVGVRVRVRVHVWVGGCSAMDVWVWQVGASQPIAVQWCYIVLLLSCYQAVWLLPLSRHSRILFLPPPGKT